MIRSLVSLFLMRKCLITYRVSDNRMNRIFFTYLSILTLFYILILSTMFLKSQIGVTCQGRNVWQAIALICLDSVQSMMIVAAVYLSWRHEKKQNRAQSVLDDSQTSIDPLQKRVNVQMAIIAIFYLCALAFDWTIYEVGNYQLQKGDLVCSRWETLQPTDSNGSLYMFWYTILTYLYALVMWFTFYRIPKKYG